MGTRARRAPVAAGLLAALAAASASVAAPTRLHADPPPKPVELQGGLGVALDPRTGALLDRMIADAAAAPEDEAAFVDAFAGLLLAYAADDPAQARAMAAYARRKSPRRAEAIAAALDLARPQSGAHDADSLPLGSEMYRPTSAQRSDVPGPGSPETAIPGAPPAGRNDSAVTGAIPRPPQALRQLTRGGRTGLSTEPGSWPTPAFTEPARGAPRGGGGGGISLPSGGGFAISPAGTLRPPLNAAASPSRP